jgi:GT2 family glycosyltransferase
VADVLVVVVTHNSAHVVDDLLDSLPAALDGLVATTVVVDNASSDDTAAVVAARNDCRLVKAPNHGYSAGINRGVQEVSGREPVLVLNPDVRMAPGSVRVLLDALAREGVGIAAPRVLDDDGHLVWSMRREPTLGRALGLGRTGRPALSEYVTDHQAYADPQRPDWALGAALLVDRRCHDELGGWDESFFLYSEETDFCLRARDRGWATVYEPAALVSHVGGQSGTSPRIHAMQILNRVRLYRRRHGAATGGLYWLLSIASEATWVLRGHPQSRDAIRALLRPATRAPELGCSGSLVPR